MNKSRLLANNKSRGISQKAFVFRKDGTFLTMRRTKTAPSNPLNWDFPGGDIEFGEDPKSSMTREILEETGLSIKELRPFDVEGHITNKGDYWITIAYKAFTNSDKITLSWEHDLYKWVTLDEFLRLKIPKKFRKFAKTLKSIKN